MNGIAELRELLIEFTNKANTLAGERCDEEIKCFLMSAALRIWSSNKMYAEAYVEALSVFDGTKYSAAQIVTALDCAGEQKRSLAIPVFFQKIVQEDVQKGKNDSRDLIECITRTLRSSLRERICRWGARTLKEKR